MGAVEDFTLSPELLLPLLLGDILCVEPHVDCFLKQYKARKSAALCFGRQLFQSCTFRRLTRATPTLDNLKRQMAEIAKLPPSPKQGHLGMIDVSSFFSSRLLVVPKFYCGWISCGSESVRRTSDHIFYSMMFRMQMCLCALAIEMMPSCIPGHS